MAEGKRKVRICSSWKEATNMAFEVPAMHSLLFTAVTLVRLVGFLRFHLLN